MQKDDWIELLLCVLAGPFYPFHKRMMEERALKKGEEDEEARCID
jgi:hypothetical protein